MNTHEQHCENLLSLIKELPATENTYKVLKAVNTLLGTYGVETVCKGDGSQEPLFECVDTGDAYTPTVGYDYQTREYIVTSWGDYVESCPQAEDYYVSAQQLAERAFACVVDGHHGIYVPQVFAERFRNELRKSGVSAEDVRYLLNPEHEDYDDVWSEIIGEDIIMDGKEYRIHQGDSGDVFLIDCAMLQEWEERMEADFWDYYQ